MLVTALVLHTAAELSNTINCVIMYNVRNKS